MWMTCAVLTVILMTGALLADRPAAQTGSSALAPEADIAKPAPIAPQLIIISKSITWITMLSSITNILERPTGAAIWAAKFETTLIQSARSPEIAASITIFPSEPARCPQTAKRRLVAREHVWDRGRGPGYSARART